VPLHEGLEKACWMKKPLGETEIIEARRFLSLLLLLPLLLLLLSEKRKENGSTKYANNRINSKRIIV